MATTAAVCDFGWRAPDFGLVDVDGHMLRLRDVKGERGTVVAFICNHCPYVLTIIDRFCRDARELSGLGVTTVAICSNDAEAYPADSFVAMKRFARDHDLPFPYLHDPSQEVARHYGAVCTPEFFGFNADLALQYHGRLDASRKEPAPPAASRELYDAMRAIAETGRGPAEQLPSIGCSIKWKT